MKDKKETKLEVRVTKEMYEKIRLKADKEQRTISNFIRRIISDFFRA